jgi:acetyl esterase/lipase
MDAETVIRIWDGREIPLAGGNAEKEYCEKRDDGIHILHNVVLPELHFYPGACGEGARPALVVAPGGGYEYLAWNLEGTEIAEVFNKAGFSVFILKYRCPGQRAAAHADACRSVRYIRANASRFNIDPARIGMIGFSAGAHLTATLCAPAGDVPYEAVDGIDNESFRPDFAALIYPAYLADDDLKLHEEFRESAGMPPVFLCQTQDDVIRAENAVAWFMAAKRNGVPAELHLFAAGGHGYGVRPHGLPVDNWHVECVRWMRTAAGL